jgi:hypothetical protein
MFFGKGKSNPLAELVPFLIHYKEKALQGAKVKKQVALFTSPNA